MTEQERMVNNNLRQPEEYHDQEPILNQQWDERLQLQPPLKPTNASTTQTTSASSRPNPTTQASTATSTKFRQVETTVKASQGQHTNTPETADAQPIVTKPTDTQPNLMTPATNRRVEGFGSTQCSCHCQQSERTHNSNHSTTQNQRHNLHTDYEDGRGTTSNFFRQKKRTDENIQCECQIIRILPSEDDDYVH